MVYIMQLYIYNETCNIEKNIYHSFLKGQMFLLYNLFEDINRQNSKDILKAKKSLLNQILTKTVLFNLESLFIEVCFAFELFKSVHNTFISKFLFIHLD